MRAGRRFPVMVRSNLSPRLPGSRRTACTAMSPLQPRAMDPPDTSFNLTQAKVEELYQEWVPRAEGFLRSRGVDANDGADLIQGATLLLLRYVGLAVCSPKALLWRILLNLLKNQRTRRRTSILAEPREILEHRPERWQREEDLESAQWHVRRLL